MLSLLAETLKPPTGLRVGPSRWLRGLGMADDDVVLLPSTGLIWAPLLLVP